MQFLSIPRVGDRFLLWRVDQANMTQSSGRQLKAPPPEVHSRRRDISNEDPLDFEYSFPFVVKRPHIRGLLVVHTDNEL